MKLPTLLVAASLLAVAGVGYTQAPFAPIPPLLPPVQLVPDSPKVAPAPQEPSLEQMLDALEKLAAEKAELERKERELIGSINKKVEKQSERMKKLGLGKPQPVERVGELIPTFPRQNESK